MALLFYDGFEGLGLLGNSAAGLSMRYATSDTAGVQVLFNSLSPPPVGGGYAYRPYSFGAITGYPVPAHASGVIHVRVLPWQTGGGFVDSTWGDLQDDASAVTHLYFRWTAAGELRVFRGNGTLLGTTPQLWSGSPPWLHVMCKYTIDDTNGGVWVKVNGDDVLRLGVYALTPATLDTRNGGSAAQVTQFRMRLLSFTEQNNTCFDDIAHIDLTGPAPYNDFLGDVRITEALVDSTVSAQFTPAAGTNHAAVDETPGHDSDTTYVASSTAGHKDVLGLAAPSTAAGTIYAARVVVVARKDGVGDQSLHVGTKFGTTEDVSAAQSLTDAYVEYWHEFDVNPDTLAALTPAAIGDAAVVYSIPA